MVAASLWLWLLVAASPLAEPSHMCETWISPTGQIIAAAELDKCGLPRADSRPYSLR